MIRILNGKTRAQHPAAVDDMFRLRKRVFHDFLKWDVQTEGDWEIDNYDQANPLYVLSYAPDTGRLRGALRLLPTLGPNMLDDTFPILLGDNPEIRSASVWESSRFCIEPEISQDRASNQVTVAAAELMCGVGELGLASGISHIVTVTDVFLERMFRRMGCPGERIAEPHRIGSVFAVAVAWEVTPDLLTRMKAVAAIEGTVLERPMSLETARAA
ncbi:acyl-homoserine-lactone synthase [Ensifer adhaerens]|uniref:Acyl-homoserine-lactone synthase n=1 Tax=Ensifer adhaerens TaxID=106592 RepID=A0A069HWX3_ENSAD|nr:MULTISPECIES: acyl-homoserine-lactone synthase [Ensifer]KSV65920.1 autoinducer synthase [Sinorhizobium sp. GL2]KSV79705.1 autoinducer synthase [Sinorhizobium sp. GW3]OWZ92965.1 autoinducer synthase [Sinorhizobium sp. LM21]ALB08727.1 acyl homoserine lactone synthetase [Ensifer adhaerens]ANK72571.1 autoinducer synthase [Ensifer adhaerens]